MDLRSSDAFDEPGQSTIASDGVAVAFEPPNVTRNSDICQRNGLNIRGGACSKRTLIAAAAV